MYAAAALEIRFIGGFKLMNSRKNSKSLKKVKKKKVDEKKGTYITEAK